MFQTVSIAWFDAPVLSQFKLYWMRLVQRECLSEVRETELCSKARLLPRQKLRTFLLSSAC